MDDESGLRPPEPDDEEGVRIIDAEEAAEVVERGEVARRKENQPKFGDRPSQPDSEPKGPRPTLRFPLAGGTDAADLNRPKVKDEVEIEHGAGAPTMSAGDVGEPPTEDEPSSRSLFSVAPDDDGGFDEDTGVDELEEFDVRESEFGEDREEEGKERPEPSGESADLPHWTEPATGEVPAAIASDRDEDDEWQSFADNAPRWRDQGTDYDDGDDLSALADAGSKVGALDPEAPGEEELYAFDELDGPKPVRRTRKPAPGPEPVAEESAAPPPAPRGAEPGRTRPSAPRRQATPGAAPATPATRRRVSTPSGGAASGPGAPAGGTGSGERDMPTAVGVGIGLALAALILMWVGPGATMVLVTVVVFLGAAEFFTTVRRAGYHPAHLLGIAACVGLPLATFWRGTEAFPIVLGLVVMAGFAWYLVGAGEERPTMNLGVTFLGIMWIGLMASFAGLLLGAWLPVPADQGVSMFLATVAVAVAADVGGFFVGRSFGRAPLSSVSPGKTIEGLAGSIVSALVVSLLLVGGLSIGPFGEGMTNAFWLGIVVGLASVLGDLAESVIKRDLALKDMGNILPGHGGVLDRMDGVLFALPAAWYLGLLLF